MLNELRKTRLKEVLLLLLVCFFLFFCSFWALRILIDDTSWNVADEANKTANGHENGVCCGCAAGMYGGAGSSR